MLRILHTGDFHLDSPMRGLTPQKARIRREEQRELLERICAIANEQEIDIVLIAGDIFDGDGVFYETTCQLSTVFSQTKAQIFIAPGNHDPYSERSPYASVDWPTNVHLFRSEYFERIELPELGAVVYGSAFTSKYRDYAPLDRLKADYDEGLTRLMVLHGDVNSPGSRYGEITQAQIAASGMDYIALGHIHTSGGVLRAGNTSYAYCGCPEGRGFDETGEKGVLLGTVSKNDVNLSFVPTAKRRYHEIKVDITQKDAREIVLANASDMNENDIVRFVLVGERVGDCIDTQSLHELLSARFFDVQVRDESVSALSLWARIDEDTLTGIFLRDMQERIRNANEEESVILDRAVRFGLAALEGREEPR